MSNISLFQYSLDNPEKYIEDFYKKESVIIPLTKDSSNNLIKNNQEIINNITSFETALKANNQSMIEWIINNMINLLKTKWINNSEFTNYWGIYDMSYSSYQNLSIDEKKDFLREITQKYLDDRHSMYLQHWYTNTTLQVRSDSVSHKRSWWLWNAKVVSILESDYNFNRFTSNQNNLEDFLSSNRWYLLPDWDWKVLFKELINTMSLNFEWSINHQNKFPDFTIKIWNHIFIWEHKHMKEGWWWQNKQIVEIIDLIKGQENKTNIHYVSFLDWVYFNRYSNDFLDAKTLSQKKQIIENLEINQKNYFVNTQWFIKLLDKYFELV